MDNWPNRIIANTEALKYLKDKGIVQNESIQRIENKVDNIEDTVSSILISIQNKQEDTNKYLRRMQWALIVVLCGVIIDIATKGGISNIVKGVL